VLVMAAAALDGVSGPESESAANGVNNPGSRQMRCVVHNFPDDVDNEDVVSKIRSVLQPDVMLCRCQPSTTGLSSLFFYWKALFFDKSGIYLALCEEIRKHKLLSGHPYRPIRSTRPVGLH